MEKRLKEARKRRKSREIQKKEEEEREKEREFLMAERERELKRLGRVSEHEREEQLKSKDKLGKKKHRRGIEELLSYMHRRIKRIKKHHYILKKDKPILISSRKESKILGDLGNDKEINKESNELEAGVKKYENLIASKKTDLIPIVGRLSHKFDEYKEHKDKRKDIIGRLKASKQSFLNLKKEREEKAEKKIQERKNKKDSKKENKKHKSRIKELISYMEKRIKRISKYNYILEKEKPVSIRKEKRIIKNLGSDEEINKESGELEAGVKKYENLIASKKTDLVPIVSQLSSKFDEYNEYQDKRREIIESLKTKTKKGKRD
jgi:hypothetical protein